MNLTLPAGKIYVAPVGTAPAEDDAYYLGQTDGAEIEAQPRSEERWAADANGVYLDDVFPTGADVTVTVSCLEAGDAVLAHGLLADVAPVSGASRFTPRAAPSAGGKVCFWHWPAVLQGEARRLWVRRALVLPNGPIRLKRGQNGGVVQVVPLRFRVLNPGGGAARWQIDHLPSLDR